NMRNLTLATIQFEKTKGAYPGYVNEMFPTNDTAFTRRSWVWMILPQLERLDLYESPLYNFAGAPQPTQELDIVKCPTNPASGANTWASSAFVVNSGLPDVAATAGGSIPSDWPANGVFFDLREYLALADVGDTTMRVPLSRQTEAYVSTGDGSTNTIMMTENADAVSWYLVGDGTGTTNNPLYERQLGCNWRNGAGALGPPQSAAPPSNNGYINRNIGGDPTYLDMEFARPSALHPNIVNVSFCDGHVRTISQDIDYLVYCLLMTPRGRNHLPAGSTTVPTGDETVFRITPLDEKGIN
ncbi:MAG: DUF1559 domain-containing protein, partial [Pirellulales bacterium]